MKLTMLGTGNAVVTKCYNTCFVIEDEGRFFMVDGGGGNTVLSRLEEAHLNWKDMHDIFITHKHVDHILGVLWMVRMICQHINRGTYEGEARIYGHKEAIEMLEEMARMLLNKKEVKNIGDRLKLIVVEDGENKDIIGHSVTFFDIQSTKAKQFGFMMMLNNGEKLTCLGDEPYSECEREYALDAKYLMHEAFCLYSQRDIFKPYEKSHSTVMDACKLASELNVENLILYHTEDKNITKRKELYTQEGRTYFAGGLFVPEDLETIEL